MHCTYTDTDRMFYFADGEYESKFIMGNITEMAESPV